MHARCAVFGCPNKAGHRFPKNEVVRKKWIKVMRLDHQRNIGWRLSTGSSVCSQHFRPSDYGIKYDSNGVQQFKRLKKHSIPSIFPGPIYIEPRFDASQVTKTYSRKERPLAFVPEIAFMDSTTCDFTEIDPLQTKVEIKIEPSVDNDDSLPYIVQENKSFDVNIINSINQCLNTKRLPKHEEVDSNGNLIKSEILTETDSNGIRIKSKITGESESNENVIKSEITIDSDYNVIRIKSETDSVYI